MEGQGPPWVRIERTVRYPTAELDAWLEAELAKAG
jgi:predicted DNA-binding transcriptional regulator AlpA